MSLHNYYVGIIKPHALNFGNLLLKYSYCRAECVCKNVVYSKSLKIDLIVEFTTRLDFPVSARNNYRHFVWVMFQ